MRITGEDDIVGNKKDNKSREIHTWVDWGGAEKLNLLPTKCKRGVRQKTKKALKF